MRGYLLALPLLLTSLLVTPVAVAGALPDIKDLRTEAKLSLEKRLPILVMFSADQCPYCMRLEEDFLKPMHNGGLYDDKVIIRRIQLGGDDLIDFDGKRVNTADLAKRYGVSVTPTVVFIDHRGHQLSQKMVGLTTPEFYGAYLDQAIDTSLDRLRRTKPVVAENSGN